MVKTDAASRSSIVASARKDRQMGRTGVGHYRRRARRVVVEQRWPRCDLGEQLLVARNNFALAGVRSFFNTRS